MDTDNIPAAREYAQIEKEISDIKYVLSLMVKHGSTSVPTDERNKIADIDILLLCNFSKAMLVELLFEKEKRLTIALGRGLSGKFISVPLHNFNLLLSQFKWSIVGELVAETLQSSYETLSNGNLQNHFIEFTRDLKLMTNHMIVKGIYIRESYKTITTLIADAMIKEDVKRFVVMGTPGIGKTIFLHYFLWLLITRQTSINDQVDRKIYLQCTTDGIFSFRGDRVVSIDAGVAQVTVLNDCNCILLVDMVEEKEPLPCAGTTIVFSSPNPRRYRQLVNEKSHRFVMNCWSLEELKAVWLHSYQHISWEDVKRIYSKMGGVIRYVLGQNEVADDRMEEGIRKCREKFIDRSKTIYQHISFGEDSSVMYRVLHIFSRDHSYDNSRFVFASSHVREECLKGLKSEEIDRVMAFLNYETANYAQGHRENHFESKRLSNAEYDDTDADSLL